MILPSEVTFKMKLKGHTNPVTSLKFRSNMSLTSAGGEPDLITWNLTETNVRTFKFSDHTDIINDVDITSNGKLLGTASKDRRVLFWSPKLSGVSIASLMQTKSVTTLNFVRNGKSLVTGSTDKSLKLWDVPTLKFQHSLLGHNHFINCARYSFDDKLIISACEDKTIKLWDASNQECIHTFANFNDSAGKISLFGNYVACAFKTGSVRIYDYMQRKLMQHYALSNCVNDIAWHPNGKFAIAGSQNGFVSILDIMTGKPILQVDNLNIPVTSVAFSTTGSSFAYGCADGHILLMACNWQQTLD